MEDSEFLCAKVILKIDIRDQYTLLTTRDLTIYPKWVGNSRVYFSSYTLSSDDRIKTRARETFTDVSGQAEASHIWQGYVIQYNSNVPFAFLNFWRNSHHQGPLAKWVIGSFMGCLPFWVCVRWEASLALCTDIFIALWYANSTQRKIFYVIVP